MAGSLLMLIAILYMGITDGTFAVPDLIAGRDGLRRRPKTWLFLGFFIAFAIKVPVFPFHSWLPDAHTEAPTAGSIILAGVLLKMGTYGFVRFNLPLFPEAAYEFAPFIAVLAIIGIIYGAIVSFAQKDVKKLVAYSSISHLGFVTLGIFSLNNAGIQGGILQGVNHGLSTGALFFLVGVLYERTHTREMSAFGGVWKVHARVQRPVADRRPVQHGPAGPQRLRRRVHHPAWLDGRGVAGPAAVDLHRLRHHRRYPGRRLPVVDVPARFHGPGMTEKVKGADRHETRRDGYHAGLLVFIVWIGIAPSGFFNLMDGTVNALVTNINSAVVAIAPNQIRNTKYEIR